MFFTAISASSYTFVANLTYVLELYEIVLILLVAVLHVLTIFPALIKSRTTSLVLQRNSEPIIFLKYIINEVRER